MGGVPSTVPELAPDATPAPYCPLCGREDCQPDQLDRQALRSVLYARTFAAALHDLGNLLNTVGLSAALLRARLAQQEDPLLAGVTEDLHKTVRDVASLHHHLLTLAKGGPAQQQPVAVPAALAEVHAGLSQVFRLDCTVDTSRLHDREIRLDRLAYYGFLSVVLQVVLLAVGSAPRTQIEIRYELEDSALRGRALLPPGAADLDRSGYNLMRLAADVHGATVGWGREAEALVLRWTYPAGQ